VTTAGFQLESGRAADPASEALFAWPAFIAHAHSHNDYEQKHPLFDALESQINSIEADLFLDGTAILVAHDRGKWRGNFEELYLKPLNQRWMEKALPTHGDEPFLLWLDIKEGSAAFREALHTLLQRYPITRSIDPQRPSVQVILTGDAVAKEAFVRENPSALVSRDSNVFSDADPPGSPGWGWYALDWTKIGTWNGQGEIPPAERKQLRDLVTKVHTKGRKLRLWKHPATLAFWQEAIAAGVDRLGTDIMPRTAQ